MKPSYSYLRAILENLPEWVYWKDKNRIYQGCNKHVAENMNLNSPSEIVNKSDCDFGWSQERINWLAEVDTKILEEGISNVVEDAIPVNGTTKIFLTSKTPLRDENGEIIGILGISTDITERKQMEMELIKAKEKAEMALAAQAEAEAVALIAQVKAEDEEQMRKTVMVLVGDIVHDLRTPIATIRTVGNLLSNMLPVIMDVVEEAKKLGVKKLDLINKKKLASIANNSLIDALNGSVVMMDDFINSTLIELANSQKAYQEGELSMDELTKCSSRRILENTLDAYPVPDHIKIHQQISYDFYLMGNTILIMKILFNLIKNAIEQITLNGKGDITITTEKVGDKNLLKIRDTAGGATPEVMANFFKGYFTTKKNGTGIGLAYCKRTMENFGGELTCHSVYGDYMEFVLSFPEVASSNSK